MGIFSKETFVHKKEEPVKSTEKKALIGELSEVELDQLKQKY